MISKVGGKSIPELVAAGRKEFASMPSGGAGAAVAAPVEAKKEEPKVVEKEEEVDIDMGDLFGY
jgi:ribosomal protein L12E/L44/L45/RPP1/RPP2